MEPFLTKSSFNNVKEPPGFVRLFSISALFKQITGQLTCRVSWCFEGDSLSSLVSEI